jgi:hypothetical protein
MTTNTAPTAREDTMKTLSWLFRGYVFIGVMVLAIQVPAAKYLPQPDCGADVLGHRLLDPYFPGVDDSTLLDPWRRATQPPFERRLLGKVMLWLPDFYNEVLVGNMRVSDYFRGGPVCHPLTLPKVRVTFR